MDAREHARLEHIRRWVRPDWERYLRPDWERTVHPAEHDAVRKEVELHQRAFETPPMRAARKREEEAELERKQREAEWDARDALLKLKADISWDRLMCVLQRYLSQKAGFNPDQPRDEQGRWTDGGRESSGSIDSDDAIIISDAELDNDWIVGEQYANVGEPPPPLGHNNPPPDVPEERPANAQVRNSAVKDVARWFGRAAGKAGALGVVITGASWLANHEPEIVASADPPKSLSELQDAVSSARPCYQRHHIVEQTSARQDGFSSTEIDGSENLVSIPTLKHREITSWYQTKNPEFGGLSPRDYLRGSSWDERRQIGLRALRDTWVLRP